MARIPGHRPAQRQETDMRSRQGEKRPLLETVHRLPCPDAGPSILAVIFYRVVSRITEVIPVRQRLIDVRHLEMDAVMTAKNCGTDSLVVPDNDFIDLLIPVVDNDLVHPQHIELIKLPDAALEDAVCIEGKVLLKSILLCKDADASIIRRQDFLNKIHHSQRLFKK
jgi:hypothetical protein